MLFFFGGGKGARIKGIHFQTDQVQSLDKSFTREGNYLSGSTCGMDFKVMKKTGEPCAGVGTRTELKNPRAEFCIPLVEP